VVLLVVRCCLFRGVADLLEDLHQVVIVPAHEVVSQDVRGLSQLLDITKLHVAALTHVLSVSDDLIGEQARESLHGPAAHVLLRHQFVVAEELLGVQPIQIRHRFVVRAQRLERNEVVAIPNELPVLGAVNSLENQ